MIPILFSENETDFTHNGIGRLVDCISCVVTEERNGIYELEMQYPISGKWFPELQNLGIIGVIHDDNHDIQPFDIYKSSAPIDGVVTFYAHHISYRLNNIALSPFTASSAAGAISAIPANSINTNPFTFTTDKEVTANFALTVPKSVRSVLMGEEGSLLDVFGKADYKFDKFTVSLLQNRGTDTGVTVRYGKNMTAITRERDESDTYSAIIPVWTDGETTVTVTGYIVTPTTPISPVVPVVMDFSGDFSEAPTEADLAAAARSYLDRNEPWKGRDNIKVDFLAMWQSPEYADVAKIQRVGLCDTVSVYYTQLGIVEEKAKVVRVVYNVLTERFDEIELGTINKYFVAITGDAESKNEGAIPIQTIVNRVISQLPPVGISASDDSAGNVTLTSSGELSATDDGNGNVTLTG